MTRPRDADLPRAGWYQRIFAWGMARDDERMDSLFGQRKRELLEQVTGNVLEIGPGAGANLRYYPPGIHWIGVEPNPYMAPYIRREAVRWSVDVEVRRGTAERLPAEDASVDVVVSTLVLCSVRDVAAALREVRRVLRPSGRFVFAEHVAAPAGTRTRRLQGLVRPLWSVLADGCRPDQETARLIEAAGFARVELERFTTPIPIIGPKIAGSAYVR
ncbi:MAG: class I SAM-dependent methyltransferase [Ktedonobacterales bacterium]|nr:class I SAM-dependent methyltransferase [Ktedonobacterales bacterium]